MSKNKNTKELLVSSVVLFVMSAISFIISMVAKYKRSLIVIQYHDRRKQWIWDNKLADEYNAYKTVTTIGGVTGYLFIISLILAIVLLIIFLFVRSNAKAKEKALDNKTAIQMNTADEIEKLHKLYKDGVLSEAEYNEAKSKLL